MLHGRLLSSPTSGRRGISVREPVRRLPGYLISIVRCGASCRTHPSAGRPDSRTVVRVPQLASTAARPMFLAEIVSLALGILPQSGNHPPNAPTITEPATDGRTLSPADVHMETAPFSDPDPGDHHLCTDWEIWTVAPSERVWH